MPAHLRLASTASEVSHLPRPDFPIRVVLADDHTAVRRSLRVLLDAEDGLEVISEAIDLDGVSRQVHGHLPHVLVLDLQMPNGSSIGLIRQLRNQVPGTEIVVLTMEAGPAFARQALDAGAIAYVLKEYADTDLPAAVRRAARGEEYVSAQVAASLDALRRASGEDCLSAREIEVLRLTALGFTGAEIAGKLHLSRRTVESHRANIHRKLGLETRAQLVQYALGRDLIHS
jgi:DNA-binding NarL/FixJ family response regulator